MLSDAKLRAIKPKEKAFKLSDGQQLYLFVTPKGGKLWRMDYNFDGKRKSLSLGPSFGEFNGRHVPHGFRAAFSTIMNAWANHRGCEDDRASAPPMPSDDQ